MQDRYCLVYRQFLAVLIIVLLMFFINLSLLFFTPEIYVHGYAFGCFSGHVEKAYASIHKRFPNYTHTIILPLMKVIGKAIFCSPNIKELLTNMKRLRSFENVTMTFGECYNNKTLRDNKLIMEVKSDIIYTDFL